MAKVAVIGAGVIGLSSARCLQMSTNVHVTIFAESFHPHTTSDGAFGIWEPYCVGAGDRVPRWGTETYKHMLRLAHSPEAAASGTYSFSGVNLSRTPKEEPTWKTDVAGFRHMSEEELSYYPADYRYGFSYTTMVTECRYYLPWLMNKFLEAGGKVVQRKIESLTELSDYDVIVNCTGLGARKLANDPDVYPILGQILRVSAPWLRHFVLADAEDLYILSGRDQVVLGGCHESGKWSREVSTELQKHIWEGCCRLVPSLKAAKVLGEWVGLRPGRSSVRLEHETVKTAQGHSCQVIHNYGHGGAGVTLHWGCALEATEKVIECLQASNKIKQTSKL